MLSQDHLSLSWIQILLNVRAAGHGGVSWPSTLSPKKGLAAVRHWLALHLRDPVRRLEDLARLGAVGAAHDAVALHQVDEVSGAAVADAKAALQQGSRGLAELQHQA